MKPLDGQAPTPSDWQLGKIKAIPGITPQEKAWMDIMQGLKKADPAPSEMKLLVEVLTGLATVLDKQAQAIDRLAASNEALVDAKMAGDEQDEDQPQRDMAGNLIRTS